MGTAVLATFLTDSGIRKTITESRFLPGRSKITFDPTFSLRLYSIHPRIITFEESGLCNAFITI